MTSASSPALRRLIDVAMGLPRAACERVHELLPASLSEQEHASVLLTQRSRPTTYSPIAVLELREVMTDQEFTEPSSHPALRRATEIGRYKQVGGAGLAAAVLIGVAE